MMFATFKCIVCIPFVTFKVRNIERALAILGPINNLYTYSFPCQSLLLRTNVLNDNGTDTSSHYVYYTYLPPSPPAYEITTFESESTENVA